MKVLITGGAGFIGGHLVDACIEKGWEPVILDDFSNGQYEVKGTEIIEGDICNVSAVRRALEGCDVVFHLAALGSVPRSMEDPVGTYKTNVIGTVNLLEQNLDFGAKVIFASSSSVYGGGKCLAEGASLQPSSFYAEQKIASERVCTQFSNNFGMDVTCLRYFNVYGPRQREDSVYSAVIPLFMRNAKEGMRSTIYGSGDQTRDFTYVKDVVDATIKASETDDGYGLSTYNIGNGVGVHISSLHNLINSITGCGLEANYESDHRIGDVVNSYANNTMAKQYLKWEPKFTLEEGLKTL